jgi:hypothetical protein
VTHYLKRAVPAALVLALAITASAAGEVGPGNIPAGSIQTAYPTQPNTTYTGAFQPDTATYHDLDYLAVNVTNPGETLEFMLQNTSRCIPPGEYEWCPVYLSILNQANTLVADGAGTIATYGDTEWLDWSFSTPGTYYLVMESNGDEPPGNPTYAVSYRVVSPGSPVAGGNPPGAGPAPPSTAPLVRGLRVAPRQHGGTVIARLKLGQRASVRAVLTLRGRHRSIVILKRGSAPPGTMRLALRLPPSYRKALTYGLSLRLSISVHGASGARATFNSGVFLNR